MKLRAWVCYLLAGLCGIGASEGWHKAVEGKSFLTAKKAEVCPCGGACQDCACSVKGACVTKAKAVSDAPSLVLPPTINVPAPGLVIITPTSVNGDAVAYTSIDPGLQLIPANLLKDSTVACGIAINPGTYRVRAVVAKSVNNVAQIAGFYETSVVVGGTPPTPPTPTPSDPFFTTLKTAFSQESASDQAIIGQLAALYSVAGNTTINDATLKTVGDFWTKFEAGVQSVLPAAALPNVRKTIGVEMSRMLASVSSSNTALDANTRQLIAQNYLRVAADLAALKPSKSK